MCDNNGYVTQAELARLMRISKQRVRQLVKQGRIKRNSRGLIHLASAKEEIEAGRKIDKNLSDDTRLLLVSWQAKILELIYKERRAELVEKKEVEAFVDQIIETAYEKVLPLADKLAPALVGEENEKKIRQILREEMIAVLSQLADEETYQKDLNSESGDTKEDPGAQGSEF